MKKAFLPFLILTLLFSCTEKEEPVLTQQETSELEVQETLKSYYVNSPSGLNLRSEPHGSVVTVLDHNAEVFLLSEPLEENKEEIGGVNGYWVNVKYGDQEGWVFDGYLSTRMIYYIHVTYHPNGATSGDSPEVQQMEQSSLLTVSENTGNLIKEDSTFLGWNTEPNGSGDFYSANDEVRLISDIDLYAQWFNLGAEYFSTGSVNSERMYLRSVEYTLGQHFMMVKEGDKFLLSPQYFEDIIDPNITSDTAYYKTNDFWSEEMGFNQYDNHRFEHDLIGAQKDGLYGFIDIKNQFHWRIEPTFDEIHPFKEGLAAVKQNGKWGYIDKSGNLIVPPQYDRVFDFYNGLSIVANGENSFREGSWGIIDIQGNTIIDPQIENPYSRIYNFYEYEIAKADLTYSRCVGLDREGDEIISDLEYNSGRGGPDDPYFSFRGRELAIITVLKDPEATSYSGDDILHGAFNKKGEWVIEPQQDYRLVETEVGIHTTDIDVPIACEDLESGDWGYVNHDREWVIEPQYQYVYDFQNGIASVRNKATKLYGVIDTDNNIVMDFQFDQALHFKNNLAVAEKNDNVGVINSSGEWVIPAEYKWIDPWQSQMDIFSARKGDNTLYITIDGKVIYTLTEEQEGLEFKSGITFIYEPIEEIDYENSRQLYKVFAIDLDGNRVLPGFFYEYVEILLI